MARPEVRAGEDPLGDLRVAGPEDQDGGGPAFVVLPAFNMVPFFAPRVRVLTETELSPDGLRLDLTTWPLAFHDVVEQAARPQEVPWRSLLWEPLQEPLRYAAEHWLLIDEVGRPDDAEALARRAAEAVQQDAEAVEWVVEAMQRAAEAVQRAAEAVRWVAEAMQRAAEAVQRAAEAVQRVAEAMQRAAEAVQ
eukprot:EG_transcript_30557